MNTQQDALDTYTAAYPQRVRDLAEVIAFASSPTAEALALIDDEDPRSEVFRECVALYVERHGMCSEEVTAAVRQWRDI